MLVAARRRDYDGLVRAEPALLLGPADDVEGKPFTRPSETQHDAALMAAMLGLERARARSWAATPTGQTIVEERDQAGLRHFLAVPEPGALLAAHDVTAIGFFGEAREGRDDELLFELERAVVASFPLYASQGLLSYYDRELEGSAFANLILFSTPDVPSEWYANAAHERAVETSPQHYHSVRLHKGSIPGPLLADGGLTIERTKYFDFDCDPPWRAVRLFAPA